MAEFLGTYLFHWTEGRAIWLGGHTLSFDARCAGIYAGFAVALLWQLTAGWRRWSLPRLRVLIFNALFLLPMLAHVGYMFIAPSPPPVNDWRFATGLPFGAALSALLVPALAVLYGRAAEDGRRSAGYFAPILVLLVPAFFLARWDSYASFVVLQALSFAGCIGLFAVLLMGIIRAVRVLVVVALLGGCASAPIPLETPPRACTPAAFIAQPAGACKREVCRDGKVAIAEELSGTAPVDDWAEERFCASRPFACLRAWELKGQSEEWVKAQVGAGKSWPADEMRYGRADAARHMHMMCLVARELGAEFARDLGAAHEEDSEYLVFLRKASPGNPCCEKVQDLYNNEVGVQLASQPGSCEALVLASMHLARHSLCPGARSGEYTP